MSFLLSMMPSLSDTRIFYCLTQSATSLIAVSCSGVELRTIWSLPTSLASLSRVRKSRFQRAKKIQVSERDAIVFRRKATVLQIVASATETDNRKKRQLIINHKLIPRLLKREYIIVQSNCGEPNTNCNKSFFCSYDLLRPTLLTY